MGCTCEIKGTISGIAHLTGTIKEGAAPGGAYPGPYEVIPQRDPQLLLTAGKSMRDDVTVWGIPYAEVSNLYGTTAIIGE